MLVWDVSTMLPLVHCCGAVQRLPTAPLSHRDRGCLLRDKRYFSKPLHISRPTLPAIVFCTVSGNINLQATTPRGRDRPKAGRIPFAELLPHGSRRPQTHIVDAAGPVGPVSPWAGSILHKPPLSELVTRGGAMLAGVALGVAIICIQATFPRQALAARGPGAPPASTTALRSRGQAESDDSLSEERQRAVEAAEQMQVPLFLKLMEHGQSMVEKTTQLLAEAQEKATSQRSMTELLAAATLGGTQEEVGRLHRQAEVAASAVESLEGQLLSAASQLEACRLYAADTLPRAAAPMTQEQAKQTKQALERWATLVAEARQVVERRRLAVEMQAASARGALSDKEKLRSAQVPPLTFATEAGLAQDAPAVWAEALDGSEWEQLLGWKKWQLEQQQQAKERLRTDPAFAREVALRHRETVLTARDRVLSRVRWSEERGQWVLGAGDAEAAVEGGLVSALLVRPDGGLALMRLTGDAREFLVDFTGPEASSSSWQRVALAARLAGVPVAEAAMVPALHEWPAQRLLLVLPGKLLLGALQDAYDLMLPQYIKDWYVRVATGVVEESFLRFVDPLLPRAARILVGLEHPATPEGLHAQEVGELTPAMIWRQDARVRNLEDRYVNAPWWWVNLPFRAVLVFYPVVVMGTPLLRGVCWLLSPARLPELEVQRKRRLLARVEEEFEREKPPPPSPDDDPIGKAVRRARRLQRPPMRLSEMAGIDSIAAEVLEIVSFLRNPGRWRAAGAVGPKGVLIVGAPGTGKTTLAQALAAEARVPVVTLTRSDLEGTQWVGQSAANVRDLFKAARARAPLIILFDNFDDFVRARSERGARAEAEHESLINQLLVELDGFEGNEGVLLLATAARPAAIDPAVRRPGRMDRTLRLPVPNESERTEILRSLGARQLEPAVERHVDWAVLARVTGGMTPRELQQVPRAVEAAAAAGRDGDEDELRAMARAMRTLQAAVPMPLRRSGWYAAASGSVLRWLGLGVDEADVRRAVATLAVRGFENAPLELRAPPRPTREGLQPHAIWAAGRALTAACIENFQEVERAWLDVSAWEGTGFVKLRDAGAAETGVWTRTGAEKELLLCLGAPVAEALLVAPGSHSTVAEEDLSAARQLATSMVVDFGWGPGRGSAVRVLRDPQGGLFDLGPTSMEAAEADVQELLSAAIERVFTLLTANRSLLEAIVERLLTDGQLSGKDLDDLKREYKAMVEPEPFRPLVAGAEVVEASRSEGAHMPRLLANMA